MSGRRFVLGLMFWVGLFVTLPPTIAQPSAAEKTKQRAESGDKAEALIREGKFADAIEPAAACMRLSKEIDGPKHWRTFDAEQHLKLAETGKGLGAEKQKRLVEAFAAEAKAKSLADDQPKESLKLAQTALEVYRELLGEETTELARVWHLIG